MSFGKNKELFKALSNETNHKIILALLKKDLCACEIPDLINKTQSNTSMHLKKLLNANILTSRREGKKIIYSIKNKNLMLKLKSMNLL